MREKASFIAHARTDIPRLLDALTEKDAEIVKLKRDAKRWELLFGIVSPQELIFLAGREDITGDVETKLMRFAALADKLLGGNQ